jgi:hypothetical protein
MAMAMAGLVLAGAALWPVETVRIRLPRRDDSVAWAVAAREGDRIRWRYRHSVELDQVEGLFRLEARRGGLRLVLRSTSFASTGTGLPTDAGPRTRILDGRLVVDQDEEMADFRFFLEPINQTRLDVAGTAIPLDHLPPGTLIDLNVEKTPWWRWTLWSGLRLSWPRQREGS